MGPDWSAAALAYEPSQALSADQLFELAAPYPWQADVAVAIILGPTRHCRWGESAGMPWVVGPAGQRGLMQLDPGHAWRFERRGWSWDDAFDPEANIAIGFEVYSESGWLPWSCRP